MDEVNPHRSHQESAIVDQSASGSVEKVVSPDGGHSLVAIQLFKHNETIVDTGILAPELVDRSENVTSTAPLQYAIVFHGVEIPFIISTSNGVDIVEQNTGSRPVDEIAIAVRNTCPVGILADVGSKSVVSLTNDNSPRVVEVSEEVVGTWAREPERSTRVDSSQGIDSAGVCIKSR